MLEYWHLCFFVTQNMQFLHKITTLRSFYRRHSNLHTGFFQSASSIHICVQISIESGTADHWRHEIMSSKEATFIKLYHLLDEIFHDTKTFI